MEDIKLLSTDDLIRELKDRSETIVIVRSTPHKTDEDCQNIEYWYSGDWLKCIGLADYIGKEIFEENQADEI